MIETILDEFELENKVKNLGKTLNDVCYECGGGIVFIGVMKGGFMFFSDLIKHINYPIEVDFIRYSSYKGQKQKELKLHYDVEVEVKDKTIFLVDDILDSGNTMKALKSHFISKSVKDIKTISVVYKENLDFPNHYYIFKQPENINPWYVGYGLDDYKGYQRNLKTINTL